MFSDFKPAQRFGARAKAIRGLYSYWLIFSLVPLELPWYGGNMNKQNDTHQDSMRTVLGALLLGGVAIGTSPIFVRLSEVGPVSSAFWRVLLVLPLFYLAVRKLETPYQDGVPEDEKKGLAWDYILCGFLFAADLALWHWSLQFTTVANATLLSNTMPIVVAIGAHFLFREILTMRFYMGMILAVAGAVILAGASLDIDPDRLLGDALAVATALFYGAYLLSVRHLRRRVRTAPIMFWAGVVTVIVLGPVAVLSGEVFLPPSLYGWGILLGLALVSQYLGQGLITYALAHLPSAFGAVTLLVQPIVAAAIAWPMFGEALAQRDMFGALIILTGIVLARLGSRKRGET